MVADRIGIGGLGPAAGPSDVAITVLSLCGSLRAGSTNQAALDTVAAMSPPRLTVSRYDGTARLPHFNPDDDHDPLPPEVVDLRKQIDDAGALLICTPEYAGALPGAFKNLLDWTVGGVEICGKPTAWINTSAGPSGAERTHESLRAVLQFTGASILASACRRIPVPRDVIGADGLIHEPSIRRDLDAVLHELGRHLERAGADT